MTDRSSRPSPLRRRMIEDMTVRDLSPATQRSYLHAVAEFSRYFGRSPDRLDIEDARAYLAGAISMWMAQRHHLPNSKGGLRMFLFPWSSRYGFPMRRV